MANKAKPLERRLAAIVSMDVEGYSRHMGEDEVGTLEVLSDHRAAIGKLIKGHKGRIVGTAGDSVLAEFASAVNAVQCASEIQAALKKRNRSLDAARQLNFRIGINVGDVIPEGDDIYGDGVNIAARLETLAEPGGVCISSTVYEQVVNKLPLGFDFLGEKQVKNIETPVQVYRVMLDGTKGTLHAAPRHAETYPDQPARSDKARVTVLILCLILGLFGDDRWPGLLDGLRPDPHSGRRL
jgi:class 3 adenylate cyclase